jgi:hypothetical protein
MKQISDQTLRVVLNLLDQTRKRLGQHAYDKRPLDVGLQLQLAEAIARAQRELINLPTVQEQPA